MRRNRLYSWLISLLVAFGMLASSPLAAREPGDGQHSFIHDGMERTYILRVPVGANRSATKLPLVLVLHGGGGNGLNAERMTGFTEQALQQGFIVAYPEGTSRRKRVFGTQLLTWNARHCCGHAMTAKVDDVGFINALLDRLLEKYPIDPKHVYITGLSNGGMMTHRLGEELAGRIAAIAPVISAVFGDEPQPTHPVAALMINGEVDHSVPVQGGQLGGRFPKASDGTPLKPGDDQRVFWAGVNGCTGQPSMEENRLFIHWRQTCPGGKDVERYLVKGVGHAWPGGLKGTPRADDPGTEVDATALILEFFKTH